VNSKNRLQNLFRGWFPQEPFSVRSVESGKGKSATNAYVVGYGVGLGIGESFIVIVDTFGWGAFEDSLNAPFSLLASMLVSLTGTMLALAIGIKLSKKLKQRWIN
jgi:hypothetical protein